MTSLQRRINQLEANKGSRNGTRPQAVLGNMQAAQERALAILARKHDGGGNGT